MQLPQLRSPFARAVVPVLAGIGFFAVLGLILWGVAAWMSDNPERVLLGDTAFTVGRVDRVADSVAESGPLTYSDLRTTSGQRSIVIDHDGTSDVSGWVVYLPFPADRAGTDCLATQTPKTSTFVDCEGRELDVTALQPATGAMVVIEDSTTLVIEFADATTTTSG